MPKFGIRGAGAKPYTIAMVGLNDAEINMYGEVVASRPVDWWTGEPVPGNFIAVDEFLKDLDELNTKDNITIHINSIGGDFYAGLAIYNRLRALRASVTTVIDGLAASAGSIIFMGGDKGKRKVNAGSNLMVHGVLNFLFGYYNAVDLKKEIKELEAHNNAAIAAYMEATGLDKETIKSAMSKDTYMTGQEAVDLGWADEVISGEGAEPVNMKLSPDKSRLMVNGHAVAACLFGKLPDSIQQMSAEEYAAMSAPESGVEPPQNSVDPAPQAHDKTIHNGGIENMEIKNVEEMRKAYPEFCASIENDARAAGAKAERERIQSIDNIQNVVGDVEMVKNGKYGENPTMDGKELLYQAAIKNAVTGGKVMAGLVADAAASGAAEVAASAAPAKEVDPDSPEAIMAQAKSDVAAFKNMKEVK